MSTVKAGSLTEPELLKRITTATTTSPEASVTKSASGGN